MKVPIHTHSYQVEYGCNSSEYIEANPYAKHLQERNVGLGEGGQNSKAQRNMDVNVWKPLSTFLYASFQFIMNYVFTYLRIT